MERFKNELTDRLVAAFLALKDGAETYAFLEDLCTIREFQDLSQRLEVARMLRDKVTYSEIAEKTGVSTATISRVNRALAYGAGGYEAVLGRLKANHD